MTEIAAATLRLLVLERTATRDATMPTRVMIVEDDLHIALLLQYNLEAAGFDVAHVDRGDAAESSINERVPDLLLLDWVLPGVSGIELCRRIRKQPATSLLPIIMLTARTERADREFATRMGANEFMTKPFAVGEVLARIRSLLASLSLQTASPA